MPNRAIQQSCESINTVTASCTSMNCKSEVNIIICNMEIASAPTTMTDSRAAESPPEEMHPLDSSLTPTSLLPFIWLATNPQDLDLVKATLDRMPTDKAEAKKLTRKIYAKQDEVMPKGLVREIRGPAFMLKEAREAIASGREEEISSFIKSRSSSFSSPGLAKRIAKQELLRHQFGDRIFYKSDSHVNYLHHKWATQRAQAEEVECLSQFEEARIMELLSRQRLVYILPKCDAFCALWKLDESRIAVSSTYTGNTETGFLETHWIRSDSLRFVPRIIGSIWPCFGPPEEFEYIEQEVAEVRLGISGLPEEVSHAFVRQLLETSARDWMRREYKIFSMKMHSLPMLPVIMKNGEASSAWLKGASSNTPDSAYHDSRSQFANTPCRRSELAVAWADEIIASPSFALGIDNPKYLAGLHFAKLEQLEWMSGRPGSLQEIRKGLFSFADDFVQRIRTENNSGYALEREGQDRGLPDYSHHSLPSSLDGMATMNPVAYARKLLELDRLSDSEVEDLIISGRFAEYGIGPDSIQEYEALIEKLD